MIESFHFSVPTSLFWWPVQILFRLKEKLGKKWNTNYSILLNDTIFFWGGGFYLPYYYYLNYILRGRRDSLCFAVLRIFPTTTTTFFFLISLSDLCSIYEGDCNPVYFSPLNAARVAYTWRGINLQVWFAIFTQSALFKKPVQNSTRLNVPVFFNMCVFAFLILYAMLVWRTFPCFHVSTE